MSIFLLFKIEHYSLLHIPQSLQLLKKSIKSNIQFSFFELIQSLKNKATNRIPTKLAKDPTKQIDRQSQVLICNYVCKFQQINSFIYSIFIFIV
ncbi:hypothetical protein TTHERM_000307820 (macronuclear) [Tetrahymena thermophila SB210]|uniref:Uncharacterized protein n=1 Tax=Tetrahymena thermophila (strain SB210) TaxID=312017 RepID=W7XGA2_TETTS|nr:hypothetical protein TTHERM_000307820 [Tetrahymena thermophila SB210]EWS73131.1 hypothetical protein TTHERM_000307820 [Tetrahymena thermophila SB210]|eukprot:XP_012654318.1 hypothetical protein TTHERM_000307820 [Tetrahymena thermophila SB210]